MKFSPSKSLYWVKIYISLLEKTFINAKAYREFRVIRIHIADPSGSCIIALLMVKMMTIMMTDKLFQKEEPNSLQHLGREDHCTSLREGLCFHRHFTPTLRISLRRMYHRTKNESGGPSQQLVWGHGRRGLTGLLLPDQGSAHTQKATPRFVLS